MATTEADLEAAELMAQTARHNKELVSIFGQQLSMLEKLIEINKKESKANRDTAYAIARENAQAKARSKMSGEDKLISWLITAIAIVILGITGVVGFNVYIDHQNDAKVQISCTQSGGTWGTRGGDDNANKYDRLCLRGAK